jgi:hypothetical protein
MPSDRFLIGEANACCSAGRHGRTLGIHWSISYEPRKPSHAGRSISVRQARTSDSGARRAAAQEIYSLVQEFADYATDLSIDISPHIRAGRPLTAAEYGKTLNTRSHTRVRMLIVVYFPDLMDIWNKAVKEYRRLVKTLSENANEGSRTPEQVLFEVESAWSTYLNFLQSWSTPRYSKYSRHGNGWLTDSRSFKCELDPECWSHKR